MKKELEERLNRQKEYALKKGFVQCFTNKALELDSMARFKQEKVGVDNLLISECRFPYDYYVNARQVLNDEEYYKLNGDGRFMGDEILIKQIEEEEYLNEDIKPYVSENPFIYALECLSYKDLIELCQKLFKRKDISGARILKATVDGKYTWTIEAIVKSEFSVKSVVASREVSIRPQAKQLCKVMQNKAE